MTATSTVARPAASYATVRDAEWSWRSGHCAALEHRFEVLVEPPGVGPALAPLVRPFHAAVPSTPHTTVRYRVLDDGSADLPYALFADAEHLISGASARDLTGMLTWHLNQGAVAASVDTHVLLHAAAAARGGITVVLPADMECGKTTTVAGLLTAGFEYVTDEAVAIDPATGRITPFPKSLTLDRGSWDLFPQCRPATPDRLLQWHVHPGQLGARTVRGSAPAPRHLVFPRYVAGARTALTPVPRAEALTELARQTFRFGRHPRRNLDVLQRWCREARSARLVIGDLDGAIDAVEELISEHLMEEL